MKKLSLLFALCCVASVYAEPQTATVTSDVRMELLKGKSAFTLKAGSVVEVTAREGDTLLVVFRKLEGRVPAAKTDFKGSVPEVATKTTNAASKPEVMAAKPNPPAQPPPVAAKPAEPKPADPKPTDAKPAPSNRDAPQSMYG